jgi:hypothetical protein
VAAVPTYDPATGQWVQQDQGNVPVTGDSGVSYSQDVWNILNKGVGSLLNSAAPAIGSLGQDASQASNGQVFASGQPAQGASAPGAGSTKIILIAAAALAAYFVFAKA